MKPTVYLETSFVGYLTARPARDVIVLANQQLTREWWERRREDFEMFASAAVRREAGAGNAEAARERLAVLEGIASLSVTDEAGRLAGAFLAEGALPEKAAEDALHVAIAATNGMDYLLTWNCKHIANATLRNLIEQVCRSNGYVTPTICTPAELF
ncbi:MAG: type II toxin-antitoxin system VapC family toxin [Rhodothermales bacterium]